ncbi:twin-arginine translocation signal domain-containing protein [Faecalibacterium sp. 9]|uniref:twin-arginine translocation signal domain-containing protein n=1 Tax=Faecalibacterium sp. 9 TaxID=3402018 RepID=UPI003AB09B20
MSNISRRKFLKGAGVAVLAVAASGVLAGCSSAPEMVDVTVKYTGWVSVTNRYVPISKGKYDETISVVKGQDTIEKKLLKNLGSVCENAHYTGKDVPEKIKIDWEGETPVAQVELRERS